MKSASQPIGSVMLLEDGAGQFYARVLIEGVAFVSGPWTTVGSCLEHVGRVVCERRQQNHQPPTDPRAWVV